jgi:predicted ATPase/DNA-binding winged helix-turn-helix (wHTH) protein
MNIALMPRSNSDPAGALGPALAAWPSGATDEEAGERGQSLQASPLGETWAGRSRSHVLVFGRFRFVVHSRELTVNGAPVPIGNRALEVLNVLIEARGDLVTKDELLERVWPTTTVEENNLQFQISSLRKALGEDREFIKTVSGRGYRFVAEVVVENRAAGRDAAAPCPDQHGASALRPQHPSGANNLPAPTSDIVGRETHLSDVEALVVANRLVTLVGAGGIGKTRIAVELARRLSTSFGDGAWVVDLAPLSDPARVRATVGAALGLGDALASTEGIAAALESRRMLLVLDNCEHVIGAVASLAEDLLHTDAQMQVVATSREPLRAEGEWVYRVPPLDIPPDDANGLEEVQRYSAAKLFLERTRAADPQLQFNSQAAAAAAQICRRLDGIPLAIELAAARVAALGIEGLAARVNDHLSLLVEGRRTAPARHQTLRATLDWSYELLSERERIIMRRLAIFSGDFTLEAATRVVGVGEIDPGDVVGNLASLVAKSLVAADVGGPISRYRLLETMRAYAMDKLMASGEHDAVANGDVDLRPDRFERVVARGGSGSQPTLLEASKRANAA